MCHPKTLHPGSKQSLNGVEGQQYILAQYALGSNLSRATVETIFNNGEKKSIFKVFFCGKNIFKVGSVDKSTHQNRF